VLFAGISKALEPLRTLTALKALGAREAIRGDLPASWPALTALTKIPFRQAQPHVPVVLQGGWALQEVSVTLLRPTKQFYQLVRDLPWLTLLVSLTCMEEGAHFALVQSALKMRREAEWVAQWFYTGLSVKVTWWAWVGSKGCSILWRAYVLVFIWQGDGSSVFHCSERCRIGRLSLRRTPGLFEEFVSG